MRSIRIYNSKIRKHFPSNIIPSSFQPIIDPHTRIQFFFSLVSITRHTFPTYAHDKTLPLSFSSSLSLFLSNRNNATQPWSSPETQHAETYTTKLALVALNFPFICISRIPGAVLSRLCLPPLSLPLSAGIPPTNRLVLEASRDLGRAYLSPHCSPSVPPLCFVRNGARTRRTPTPGCVSLVPQKSPSILSRMGDTISMTFASTPPSARARTPI